MLKDITLLYMRHRREDKYLQLLSNTNPRALNKQINFLGAETCHLY